MDIHQLELFLAVMNSPSMTRAAEKVHLSPGAVSLQLHSLAEELRSELFVHRGKRLIPTPAASRLAEHAQKALTLMGHIQQEFQNDVTQDTRTFHFATGVTTLIYQLGSPLRQLRTRFPNAKISITVGVTEEMVAGLLDRRLIWRSSRSPFRKTISRSSRSSMKNFSLFVPQQKEPPAVILAPYGPRNWITGHFIFIRNEATCGGSSTHSSRRSASGHMSRWRLTTPKPSRGLWNRALAIRSFPNMP